MKCLSITITLLSLTLCRATWNYGYSMGNTGAYTVIKPAFTGVRPEYVIMKPSYSALRAGFSVFKPNYNGMKAQYKPDYISRPSYSGLRSGLNPTYLADRHEKELKPSPGKKYVPKKPVKKDHKPLKTNNKIFNLVAKPQLLANSKIFVKQLDSHSGNVVRTYQVENFDQIVR